MQCMLTCTLPAKQSNSILTLPALQLPLHPAYWPPPSLPPSLLPLQALIEKHKHLPEIKRIVRHRQVPTAVYKVRGARVSLSQGCRPPALFFCGVFMLSMQITERQRD